MVQDSFNVQEKIEETGLGELEELSAQMEELESEESELESEELEFESEELEFESGDIESGDIESGDIESGDIELEFESKDIKNEAEKEILKHSESLDLDEDVFETWDDAEEAFVNFDIKSKMRESISNGFDSDQENFEKAESYCFTEEELKEIVSSSVQKALEKSIASSLVELAVSELKTTVSEMDQDWA